MFTVVELPSEIILVGKAGALDFEGSIGATADSRILGGPEAPETYEEIKDPDVIFSDSYYLKVILPYAGFQYILSLTHRIWKNFSNRGVSLRILGELQRVCDHVF